MQGARASAAIGKINYPGIFLLGNWMINLIPEHRADSRFAPSQWETALLCNASDWLGASLESALEHFDVNPWLFNHLHADYFFYETCNLILYFSPVYVAGCLG